MQQSKEEDSPKNLNLLEAVRYAENSNKTRREIADGLGIAEVSLFRWCKAYGKTGEKAFKQECIPEDLEAENRRLKLEIKRLEEEREILKKAAAFFAAESR